MAKIGKLSLAVCMGAKVRGWRASVDVPVQGSNEELAVQQTPGHHSSWPVQGRGVVGLPCRLPGTMPVVY